MACAVAGVCVCKCFDVWYVCEQEETNRACGSRMTIGSLEIIGNEATRWKKK